MIPLDAAEPIAASVSITTSAIVLGAAGASTQLIVTGTFADGTTADVSLANTGTEYSTSNRAVATVSGDGLVTAVSSGTVLISAMNEGALGIIRIQVTLTVDSDGDGIPDDVELANGLNPLVQRHGAHQLLP